MSAFRIDGVEFDADSLTDQAKKLFLEVQKIDLRINETKKMSVILNRAKSAYIADLKTEMLAAKAGIDFGDE